MTLAELTAEMDAFRDAMIQKGHAPGEVEVKVDRELKVGGDAWITYQSECLICRYLFFAYDKDGEPMTTEPCPGPQGGAND